jgi:YebC/PmpR family DNA-binding regulatory protein
MSGHSKWHNIRLKKGKADAQRGALFTKLSKEIVLAAKSGSPDPDANYRLKMAVEKARENNMPQDNVKRAIVRGSGQSGAAEIEEIRYEGFGPGAVAVIIDAATDNRNRTAGELRFLFGKEGGSLGETGSVAWMFEAVGVVECDPRGRSEDAMIDDALVDGVADLEFGEPVTLIYTEPSLVTSVRDALIARGFRITDVYLGMRAKTKSQLEGKALAAAVAFLEELDEHEDVARVFSNLDLTEAALEALA